MRRRLDRHTKPGRRTCTSSPNHHNTPESPARRAGRYGAPGVIEAKLSANHFELELNVDGYEFPDFNTSRDGNALTCEIELDLQGRLDLHAAHTLILYTFDLADFVDQLRKLEHAQDGEATFGPGRGVRR